MNGNLVKRIVKQPQVAGMYEAAWDGRNEQDRWVRSGIYLLRIVVKHQAGETEKSQRKIAVAR